MAYDLSSATNAVKTLINFPNQINTASSSLNGISVGPWTVSVDCSYGSCNNGHCSYTKSLDFTTSRKQLLAALADINQYSIQFLGSLRTELQVLHNTATLILTELQTLIPEISNPQFANKYIILLQLNNISTQLSQNANDLVSGNQSFAQFGTKLHALINNLSTMKNGMEQDINNALQNIRQYINSQPCGGESANAQLNANQKLFNNSFNTINQSFDTLYGQCQNAENAVNILIGTFATFITQWNTAIQNIAKTTDALGYNTAIANLDAHVALLQWTDFSNEIDQINL